MSVEHVRSMLDHLAAAERWAADAERLATQDPGSSDHDVAIDMALMHAQLARTVKAVKFPA